MHRPLLFIIIALAHSFHTRAQDHINKLVYIIQEETSSQDKLDLYHEAKQLFISDFNKAENYLMMNSNTGHIVGGGTDHLNIVLGSHEYTANIRYRVSIEISDSQYVLTLDEFEYKIPYKKVKDQWQPMYREREIDGTLKHVYARTRQKAVRIKEAVATSFKDKLIGKPVNDNIAKNDEPSKLHEEATHW